MRAHTTRDVAVACLAALGGLGCSGTGSLGGAGASGDAGASTSAGPSSSSGVGGGGALPEPCTTRVSYGHRWIHPPDHPESFDVVDGLVA